MTYRTLKTVETFEHPFMLGGFDEVLPAGEYRVETDEELLQDISFPAYRRIRALVYLHAKSVNPGPRVLTIAPSELDAALARDKMTAEARAAAEVELTASAGAGDSDPPIADQQDIERADDEGMFHRSN